MEKTVREIAGVIGATVQGDAEVKIRAVRGIEEAAAGDLVVLTNKKLIASLEKTCASAAIIPSDVGAPLKTVLKVANPTLALAQVLRLFYPDSIPHPRGIHPTALIGEGVRLGKDVALGPYTVIGDACAIGDRTVIYGGVHIGPETTIGSDGVIYPRVTVRERIRIGDRVIIHPGAVIGADGYGFASTEKGHEKIPQVGTVIIEDDVEIGANVCIDRATLEASVIGRGTKFDNLVQIGHNVVIGPNCLIISQVGISGSVQIGRNVVLAGQVGVRDHVTLSDGVRVGGQAGIGWSLTEAGDYIGSPAIPRDRFWEIQACLGQLPELVATVEELKKKLNSV